MTLSEELQWRGFVNQTTLSDIKQLDNKHFKLYFGVDPSADSMQVGNLASAMMVKTFARHGHDATLLIGGATGMIGDPSGKDAERSLLDFDQVARNKRAIIGQYHQLFGQRIRVVDNYDWFKNIGYLEFLREIGKHFSLTPLLQRDYIASRVGPGGAGMSYAEFSYTLIQGYDFYHLNKKYGVNLQVCGSDQWGNSLSGVDLIRRKLGKEAHVFSAPLIVNKQTGKKFGKSEEGAVWLDPKKTSVYKFYQFWLNVDDDSAAEYLKVFTELSKSEIAGIMKAFEQSKSARLAQKTLAYEVTALVHGNSKADTVKKITDTLFGDGQFLELGRREVNLLKAELSVVHATKNDSPASIVVAAGLATSNTEAARFIEAAAISVNGQKINQGSQLTFVRGANLLKRGKNSFAIVEYK